MLASTSEVYGPSDGVPFREDDTGPVNPVDTYGAYYESRRFSEALTTTYRSTYNVSTAIARIFSVYGPRMRLDDGRILSRFVRQAVTGAPLTVPGSGTQTRTLCYVDDAVNALMALASGTYPGPVNIGSPEELTVYSLARELVEIVGPGADVVFVDAPGDAAPTRRPDITLATELLGWHPCTSLKEGLASTVAWFKSAGALRA